MVGTRPTPLYDAAVVGAGVIGSWAAISLAKQGKKVALLDRWKSPHPFGSSHGDSRIFRLAYEQEHYVHMMKHSLPLWKELQNFAKEKIMATTGGISVETLGGPALHSLCQNYDRCDIEYERLSANQVNNRFPQFSLAQNLEAVYQPDFGILFASKAVAQAYRFASTLGADCLSPFHVVSICTDHQNGSLDISAADGRQIRSKSAIIAPG